MKTFTKGAGGGVKCDHSKLGVCARVRAHLNLDVQGACVPPKTWSQLTPCFFDNSISTS